MTTISTPPIEMPHAEPTSPSTTPIEISFPLPKTPHTTAHVHLTFLATSTMVFLATTTPGDSAGTMKPLGSFVYAMPDVGLFFLILISCLSLFSYGPTPVSLFKCLFLISLYFWIDFALPGLFAFMALHIIS